MKYDQVLEYELNFNIKETTTILCSRTGVLVFIQRIPIFEFHSLMQFSKVRWLPVWLTIADDCIWEICCLFNLIYGLGQWDCLTVNRSSGGSQYILTSQRWATWLLSSPAWMLASKKLSLWCSYRIVKFIYSEKASKFCKIPTVDLTNIDGTNLLWRFRKVLRPRRHEIMGSGPTAVEAVVYVTVEAVLVHPK